MCNCIQKIEETLNKEMINIYPNTTVIAPVEMKEKMFPQGSKSPILLNNPTSGKVRLSDGTIREFTSTVRPLFCAYCAEPISDKP